MSRLADYFPFKDFFALDVRSLALFRVLLATLLLLDWLCRLPDLSAHYTDDGVLPRDLLASTVSSFSVHLFSGAYWYQALLAGLAILFALALLVGYHTPLMGLLSFILLVSVHGRNPTLMQGGDHMLRAMLFWSIFLPLGARFSVDAAGRDPGPNVVRSLGSFALISQIVIIYLFAAVFKWDEQWRAEASAVHRTLTNESFTTRIGYLVRGQPWLCTLLTHSTVYLETLGPVALFLPFHVGLQRMVVIVLFVGFHAGLALTMELDNFPFLGMMIWSALIPPSFWDRVGPQLPDLSVLGRWVPAVGGDWRPPAGPVPTAVLGLCFAYVLFFNVHNYLWMKGELKEPKESLSFLPPQFAQLGIVTGLDQGWGLFAPRPTPTGGWHLAIGKRADGTEVELLRGTSPPDRGKPQLQSTTYANARWRKMIQNLGFPIHSNYLPPGYARWLLQDYNRRHPDNPLTEVSLFFVRQATYAAGDPIPPSTEQFVIAYTAEGDFFVPEEGGRRRWRLEDGKFVPKELEKAGP